MTEALSRKIAQRLNSPEYYESLRGKEISEVDAMAAIISSELAEREKAVEAAIQALREVKALAGGALNKTRQIGYDMRCFEQIKNAARAALSGLGVKQ